jgi:hypothetical protein
LLRIGAKVDNDPQWTKGEPFAALMQCTERFFTQPGPRINQSLSFSRLRKRKRSLTNSWLLFLCSVIQPFPAIQFRDFNFPDCNEVKLRSYPKHTVKDHTCAVLVSTFSSGRLSPFICCTTFKKSHVANPEISWESLPNDIKRKIRPLGQ